MFGRFAQPNSSVPGVSNPAATSSPFGSSIFGAPQGNTAVPGQQPSAFGGFGSSQGISAGNPSSLAAPTTPYSITNDYENNLNIKLLAISAMPAYRNRSFEVRPHHECTLLIHAF